MRVPSKAALVKAIVDIVDAEDAREKAYLAYDDTSRYRAHLETMISAASNLIGPYVVARSRYAAPCSRCGQPIRDAEYMQENDGTRHHVNACPPPR